ncbi:MAG: hypothetical protein IJS39_04650 [Synergistaceae bacterium]|nr:hypothetical protein [Synergistaceae bacterium]
MLKKLLLSAVLVVLIAASVSFAASPVPPENGQWALALESTLPLHRKADIDSDFEDADMPNKWLRVPSAVRDDDNYLWYKVTIDGKTGWLPQNGVRLKMGGKSKIAANLYKNYVKARKKVMAKPKGWDINKEDEVTSYYSDGGEFRVIKLKKGIEDVFFSTDDPKTCREFLGVDLIGKSQPQARKILGTPTMRESPAENRDINVLSYELPDKDITFVITERREDGDTEGTVTGVSFYRGRTGEAF